MVERNEANEVGGPSFRGEIESEMEGGGGGEGVRKAKRDGNGGIG